MRILLINVPHPAIGSRISDDHLPPGPTVSRFWGAPQDAEEESMTAARPVQSVGSAHQNAYRARQIARAVTPAGQTRV